MHVNLPSKSLPNTPTHEETTQSYSAEDLNESVQVLMQDLINKVTRNLHLEPFSKLEQIQTKLNKEEQEKLSALLNLCKHTQKKQQLSTDIISQCFTKLGIDIYHADFTAMVKALKDKLRRDIPTCMDVNIILAGLNRQINRLHPPLDKENYLYHFNEFLNYCVKTFGKEITTVFSWTSIPAGSICTLPDLHRLKLTAIRLSFPDHLEPRSSFANLSKLPLKVVSLSGNVPKDFFSTYTLPTVSTVFLDTFDRNQTIQDFPSLKNLFPNLQKLIIESLPFKRLTLLKSLNIKALWLSYLPDLPNLSDISNQQELQDLRLKDLKNVADFTQMHSLPKLRRVSIIDCDTISLCGVENLPIKEIEIVNSNPKNLEVLTQIEALSHYTLVGPYNEEQIAIISSLKQLQEVSITGYSGKLSRLLCLNIPTSVQEFTLDNIGGLPKSLLQTYCGQEAIQNALQKLKNYIGSTDRYHITRNSKGNICELTATASIEDSEEDILSFDSDVD